MARESVDHYCQKAQQALGRGDHAEARGLFLQALEVRSDIPDAHYGLATVCFLQGDVLGAAHHFKEVTRLDPLRAGAFINLGAIYNHLGRLDDAVHALRRGIQLEPTRAEGYYNLGLIYRRQDQLDLAIESYREAVRFQPDLGDAHFNLGNIYLELEKFAHAVTHYRQALKEDADWPEALQGLEMAEAALEEDQHSASGSGETVLDASFESSVSLPQASVEEVDSKRQLDPALHGNLMADIHLATAEAEKLTHIMGEEVTKELEAALKDVSACLLRSDIPTQELAQHLDVFNKVVSRFQRLHRQFQELHDRVHEAGDDLRKK